MNALPISGTVSAVSDYSTEDMREAFTAYWEEDRTAFDHWLAAHDAEVYERGRKDAAEATLPVSYKHRANEGTLVVYAHEVYAAARGDGEQA